jgi:hypothetical protein
MNLRFLPTAPTSEMIAKAREIIEGIENAGLDIKRDDSIAAIYMCMTATAPFKQPMEFNEWYVSWLEKRGIKPDDPLHSVHLLQAFLAGQASQE